MIKHRETRQDSNSNSTFIALNLYLLTDSKTHKARNQRSQLLNQGHCRGRHHGARQKQDWEETRVFKLFQKDKFSTSF